MIRAVLRSASGIGLYGTDGGPLSTLWQGSPSYLTPALSKELCCVFPFSYVIYKIFLDKRADQFDILVVWIIDYWAYLELLIGSKAESVIRVNQYKPVLGNR